MKRPLQVAGLLAGAGHHRRAGPADLVIAAAAEAAGPTLLHYDNDYERIGAVTHQLAEWVAPACSLDCQGGRALEEHLPLQVALLHLLADGLLADGLLEDVPGVEA